MSLNNDFVPNYWIRRKARHLEFWILFQESFKIWFMNIEIYKLYLKEFMLSS